jgi:acetylornithine deacetylase
MLKELTAPERAALDAIDPAAIATMLTELVRIPSITGSAAEADAQHWVAAHLNDAGLDVDLWSMDLPSLRAQSSFPGTEAPRDEAWGLVGLTPESDGPTVILQGHVDVVPVGDVAQWPHGDPFSGRIADGVLYGRGACDMKAGVVANLMAVRAIREAGVPLGGRIAVHSVVGEEDGGLGAFGTLQRGYRGDACLISEPTGGTVVTANGGALTFRISVPGRATHGSTRYDGVSALDAYLPLHAALAALEAERNRDVDPLMAEYPIAYSLSVGKLSTGDWASSVPDLLVAEGRLGVAIDEDPEAARAEFEQRIGEACAADSWLRDHPATVEWTGGQFASGRMPLGHPLATIVRQAYADATGGPKPRERGAPYGSDLRLYAADGVPTLQFGPGDVSLAHSPFEQVALDEVVAVCRTLVLTVLRLCRPGH